MQLLIKEKIFSWRDSYNIYDENENKKYFVKGKIISLTHTFNVYDNNNNKVEVETNPASIHVDAK